MTEHKALEWCREHKATIKVRCPSCGWNRLLVQEDEMVPEDRVCAVCQREEAHGYWGHDDDGDCEIPLAPDLPPEAELPF